MAQLSRKDWEELSIKLFRLIKIKTDVPPPVGFYPKEDAQEIEDMAFRLASNVRCRGEATIAREMAPKGGPAEKKALEMLKKYEDPAP